MDNCLAKRQSGAVLVISLVMLLLLTLIGVTGTQTTMLQEKMAGNMRDKDLAFQAAESALRLVEQSIVDNDAADTLPIFDDAGTGGYYSASSPILNNNSLATDYFWLNYPVATSTLSGMSPQIDAAPPRFVVQQMPPMCIRQGGCLTLPPGSDWKVPYKITVRATGGSPNASVILQSIFSPP